MAKSFCFKLFLGVLISCTYLQQTFALPYEIVPQEFSTSKVTIKDMAPALKALGDTLYNNAVFDGDWYNQESGLGIHINGKTITFTASNNQKQRTGDIAITTQMLVRSTFPVALDKTIIALPWFDGLYHSPDGKLNRIQGRLTPAGRLLIIEKGWPNTHWAMERVTNGKPPVDIVKTDNPKETLPQSVPTSAPPADTCKAPVVAMDTSSPNCQQRWQTFLFRNYIPPIFSSFNDYVDKWSSSSDSGSSLAQGLVKIGNLAYFFNDVNDLGTNSKQVIALTFKNNSMLLMMGFEDAEKTPSDSIATATTGTLSNEVETILMEALKGTIQVDHPSTIGTAVIKADPATIALDLTSVANDLFAYANTVRYARLRNSYTLTLEYLRLLYRVGGDQNEFATRLGLATNASILDCIKAVNKKKFGFKTNITKADSYNPDLVKKLVEHWTSVITDLATLKQNNP